MKYHCLIVSLFLTSFTYARSLSVHVHGAVKLDVATDNKQLLILLKSPAESFLGFEHKAKNAKEKALVERVKKDWEEKLLSYLGQSQLSDCKLSKSNWTQSFEGKNHSNITAEAYINCKNRVAKRTLQVSLHNSYPNITTIQLQLLRENGTVINKKYTGNFKVKL